MFALIIFFQVAFLVCKHINIKQIEIRIGVFLARVNFSSLLLLVSELVSPPSLPSPNFSLSLSLPPPPCFFRQQRCSQYVMWSRKKGSSGSSSASRSTKKFLTELPLLSPTASGVIPHSLMLPAEFKEG